MCASKNSLGLVILALSVNLFAQSGELPYEQPALPRIFLRLEEKAGYSRLIWQFSQPISPESLPVPVIQPNPRAGEFVITLQNIAAASFFGPLSHTAGERFPIEYTVNFPDSNQITLQGRTKPFDHLTSAYQYDNNCYVFDIYYLSGFVGEDGAYHSMTGQVGRWRGYLAYIWRAVPLAAAIVLLIAVYLVMTRRRSRPTAGNRPKPEPVKVPPVQMPLDQPPAPVAPSEEQIRKVAQEKKISYDEAALLLNLSQEDKDVVG